MIYVNGNKIELTRFPDGTPSFKLMVDPSYSNHVITWRYDGDYECIAVWNIVHHIRSQAPRVPINLRLPYVPNARMDRVKHPDEIFTLKWFAEFINALQFDNVVVTDAHSSVALGLIGNVVSETPLPYINQVFQKLEEEEGIYAPGLLICFPDEGAYKRYSDILHMECVFGIKHRDWVTGDIERLEITTPERVAGRNVLIVDDICSRGGTFTYTASALKEAGAGKIYLYVTHCENTIREGSVLTDGLIEHVYTTDSIFRGEHDKITVL